MIPNSLRFIKRAFRSSRTNDTSLIDFDDPVPSTQPSSTNPVDDLASLFGSSSVSAPGSITLGSSGGAQPPWSQPYLPQQQPLSQPIPQLLPQYQTRQHQQPPGPTNRTMSPPNYNASGMFSTTTSSPSGAPSVDSSPFGSIMLPGTPQPRTAATQSPQPQSPPSRQDIWGALAGNTPATSAMRPSSMVPAQGTPPTNMSSSANGSTSQKKDPFSDLVGLF